MQIILVDLLLLPPGWEKAAEEIDPETVREPLAGVYDYACSHSEISTLLIVAYIEGKKKTWLLQNPHLVKPDPILN